MSLSSEPLVHQNVDDYRSICEMTSEGMYLNIVDKGKSDSLAEQFFATMDVYPIKKYPNLREYF